MRRFRILCTGVVFACFVTLGYGMQTAPWENLLRDGVRAYEQGRYQEARRLLETALAEAALGAQDIRLADLDDALARVYQVLGEPDKAERLYLEAHAILEKHGEPEPALRSLVLRDLGVFREGQGRLEEAEALLKLALEISVRVYGERDSRSATAMSSLGQLYVQAGRLADAETLLRRALELQSATLPPWDIDRIWSHRYLGILYMLESRYTEAEPILQQVNRSASELGESHPVYAATLVDLADLYRFEGRAVRGEPLLRKALAIYEAALGPDSRAVAETLLNLCIYELAAQKPMLAETEIRRALRILRHINGPDYVTVAVGESRLAQSYTAQQKYPEAEALLEHALPILQRTYPAGHNITAECHSQLGELAALRHRYTEAQWHFEQAVSIYEKVGGPSNAGLATVLQNYARLLRINRAAEAKALEARAKQLEKAAKTFR